MDPVTHTMAGAVLARAGLDRRGTLPMGAATLMMAANAPDVDVLALFLGAYAGLAFRRGWTHGPIAMVLLPFAITALVLGWHRWVGRRRAHGHSASSIDPRAILGVAFIGVLSHPALDWLNTYGIRLLAPFSDRWFYGDAVFIVDPWLWLLLAAALLPWRRTRRRVRAFAVLAGAYVLAMIAASMIAEQAARRAAVAAGFLGIQGVMYQPAPARPHRGSLIVATREAYMVGTFRWLAASPGRVTFLDDAIPRGDWTSPEVRQAMTDTRVRNYLVWSRFPFVRVDKTPQGTAVFFGDARFTDGPSGGGLQGVHVTGAAPTR